MGAGIGVGVGALRAAAAFPRDSRDVGAVLALYVLYAAVMWGRNMRPRMPRALAVLYNAALSVHSLVFFVALLVTLVGHARAHSLWHLSCAADALASDATLAMLYRLHTTMRIVELLDTVLIVHSSRPLTFLHVWHHAATLALAHLQIVDATPLQWLTLLLNAAVHAVMYAFYALSAVGAPPRWKRAVTVAQIAQFCAILGVYGGVAAARALGALECYATARAAAAAFFVLASYLVLFLRFYARAYRGAKRD